MIRAWIKTGTAGALSRTGMDKIVGSLTGACTVPVVIGYHRVVEDFESSAATSIPSMLISRRMLEHHLDWIGRHFRFASLDEVGARLNGSDTSRDPILALTFDDGYRDFFDHAFPLLKRKGIPAAVFVVTGLVNTSGVQDHDRIFLLLAGLTARRGNAREFTARLQTLLRRHDIFLPNLMAATPFQATRALIEGLPQEALRRVAAALESESTISDDTFKPFHSLTWEMIDTLQRSGMTIGSHTRTHVLITNESRHRVIDEVSVSRKEIENRLGTTVRHFAYPSGQFNSDSVEAVANAGYQFAYTVCRHRDGRYPQLTVPRTLLWENSCRDYRGNFSGSILGCQLHRAFDIVSGCRQRHRITRENRHARQ